MIIDNLSNAANYFNLHPLFEKAFDFIKELNMETLQNGNVEIDGAHLKASIVEISLKPANEAKLETHKKHIDIQVPVTGAETFGWKSLSTLNQSENGYDETNDIEFYADAPSTHVTLLPGEFVIFSPEDGHAPLIGEGNIQKIILKIAVI